MEVTKNDIHSLFSTFIVNLIVRLTFLFKVLFAFTRVKVKIFHNPSYFIPLSYPSSSDLAVFYGHLVLVFLSILSVSLLRMWMWILKKVSEIFVVTLFLFYHSPPGINHTHSFVFLIRFIYTA